MEVKVLRVHMCRWIRTSRVLKDSPGFVQTLKLSCTLTFSNVSKAAYRTTINIHHVYIDGCITTLLAGSKTWLFPLIAMGVPRVQLMDAVTVDKLKAKQTDKLSFGDLNVASNFPSKQHERCLLDTWPELYLKSSSCSIEREIHQQPNPTTNGSFSNKLSRNRGQRDTIWELKRTIQPVVEGSHVSIVCREKFAWVKILFTSGDFDRSVSRMNTSPRGTNSQTNKESGTYYPEHKCSTFVIIEEKNRRFLVHSVTSQMAPLPQFRFTDHS